MADGDHSKLFKACLSIDKLLSRITTESNHKRKANLVRVSRRLKKRLRNKVDEVHKQLCKFIVTNFDLILLPTFETSQMVSRYERKIATKTARQMLNWGHYRFKQRLLCKAQQCGSKVAIVNEAYTSKAHAVDF